MARETRRIGITTAQVRLPQTQSFGPALVKTAATFASREFDKLADTRTQEAIVAASALNFERDAEGNLIAPTVPIGDNGLLAPSIYDRKYTQMVGQRYLQQMQIDISETINGIAADNPFEPETFRTLAEGYVSKVTDLAPDYLKADVNNAAQVKMVEHFNHIIRVRAERDHAEAKGLQIITIDGHMDDLAGYVAGGADPEIVGGAMLKARAAIEQGDEFHFWLDDEKQHMLDAIDRQYAIASISKLITSIPQGDEVAYSDVRLALNSFARGEGTFPMVDEAGNVAHVPLDEMPINQLERIAIADFGTRILNDQEQAFTNTLDTRVQRDWEDFFNWYSPHAMEALTGNTPIDMDRLEREFNSAHRNVVQSGYDDVLREKIRQLMTDEVTRSSSGSPTAFQKAFLPGWVEWHAQMEIEQSRLRSGAPRSNFTPEQLDDMWQASVQRIGNIPGGYREQNKGAAQQVNPFYTALTGKEMTREYYADLIDNPGSPEWQRMETVVPQRMARIGIWPDELRDTIIGRLMNPEGMNQDTLDQTLKLARLFWDQPTFRRNMMDDSAIGGDLGRMLNSVFNNSGRIPIADLAKKMERFSDPSYSPYKDWADRDPESKQAFLLAAQTMIERSLEANWRSLWTQQGRRAAPEFDWNMFGDNIPSLPPEIMRQVKLRLQDHAGDINDKNPSEFMPFIAKVVQDVMRENDYGATKIGFTASRYSNYNDTVWWKPKSWLDLKPAWGIVSRPPENFALRERHPGLGNRDPELMEFVWKDFQDVLNHFAKERGLGEVFKAGVNAGLQYDAQLSSAQSNGGVFTPTWRIILVGDDGQRLEILTEDGLYEGRPVPFNLNHARDEKNKADQIRWAKNIEITGSHRNQADQIPISP